MQTISSKKTTLRDILMATSFVLLFFISSTFLMFYANSQLSSQNKTDWWLLYFDNPKDQSADFVIENNSRDMTFHWEIFLDKTRVQQGDLSLTHGKTGSVPVKTTDLSEKKVLIVVTDASGNSKEIYKQL